MEARRDRNTALPQGAPLTRQTYASVYRAFGAFVGPDASADEFTSERMRAYRDELETSNLDMRPVTDVTFRRLVRGTEGELPFPM